MIKLPSQERIRARQTQIKRLEINEYENRKPKEKINGTKICSLKSQQKLIKIHRQKTDKGKKER